MKTTGRPGDKSLSNTEIMGWSWSALFKNIRVVRPMYAGQYTCRIVSFAFCAGQHLCFHWHGEFHTDGMEQFRQAARKIASSVYLLCRKHKVSPGHVVREVEGLAESWEKRTQVFKSYSHALSVKYRPNSTPPHV